MNMKEHILAALREQLERWEIWLASLSEEELTRPRGAAGWSLKDEMAHLMAWQQRSIARLEAGLAGREPEFPQWLAGVDPEDYDNTDEINAAIYEAYRQLSWTEVHELWREGYLRLLEAGEGIAQRDLLDGSRYPWLGGYNLAYVLVATYDHHEEHYEWMEKEIKGSEHRG